MKKPAGKNKKTIGLLSAVPLEGSLLVRGMDRVGEDPACGLTFFTGRLSGSRVVYAASGIGKTNAAHAAALLIERHRPSLIINFGLGGAYPSSGLSTGDIAVATKEIYADEGVLLGDGFHTLETIGLPFFSTGRKKYFNEFPLDR